METYQEAKALLSNKLGPSAGFEQVFEAVLQEFVDKHSPQKRQERREKRGSKKKAPAPKHDRHIPAAVRDEVFARDGGKCTYLGSNGKQCGSTLGLHIDHVTPFAKGGSNEASNLRLLCANHNRLEAERAYGQQFMQQYYQRE